MSEVHVFTSAARNYGHKVRLLFKSLSRHHPEWRLHWLLPDAVEGASNYVRDLNVKIWSAEDLSIADFKCWAFKHELVEFATAVKPFMFEILFAEDEVGAVLYFDPDIVVYSRLDDLIGGFQEASVLLTPHQNHPEHHLEAVLDNEICSLKHGVYNLGFLGVKKDEGGRNVISWWRDRLYQFCRDDIPNGLFTDQRWFDLAPALFDCIRVERGDRFNVSTWNLTTRFLEKRRDGYYVNGEPLGFYHFTGFNSGAHHVMAAKNSFGNQAVMELIRDYQLEHDAELRRYSFKFEWAYSRYTDGSIVASAHRKLYRARMDLQKSFPDPYDARQFLAWMKSQGLYEADTQTQRCRNLVVATSSSSRPKGGLVDLIAMGFRSPVVFNYLIRRSFEIYRHEGFRGVMARVKRIVGKHGGVASQ